MLQPVILGEKRRERLMLDGNGYVSPSSASLAQPRAVGLSLKRGLRGKCPACGEGRILHSYLKVNDVCPSCAEELHHQQADDFPQYITIFVVAHVLIASLLVVDEYWPDLPLAVHFTIWPSLVIVLCLCVLPKVKGMLIAYQWALRMHGFETAHRLPLAEDQPVTQTIQRKAA